MKRLGKRAKKPTPITKTYKVEWEETNFKLRIEDALFYGWWRKVSDSLWAVDIYAKVDAPESGPQSFTLQSFGYAKNEFGKLEQLSKISAQIRFRCEEWMAKRNNSMKTIDQLIRDSRTPTVIVRTIESLDSMLIKLREYRDTAIRAGGRRYFVFEPERKNDPQVTFDIDLSRQAHMLAGKVPPIGGGLAVDTAGQKDDDGNLIRRAHVLKPSAENVDSIVKQLKDAKARDDKVTQRKLRAMLRKMGHKGGARSADAQKEVKHEEVKKQKRVGKRAKKQ